MSLAEILRVSRLTLFIVCSLRLVFIAVENKFESFFPVSLMVSTPADEHISTQLEKAELGSQEW